MTLNVTKRANGSIKITDPKCSRNVELVPGEVAPFTFALERFIARHDSRGLLPEDEIRSHKDSDRGYSFLSISADEQAIVKYHQRTGWRIVVIRLGIDDLKDMLFMLNRAEKVPKGAWRL